MQSLPLLKRKNQSGFTMIELIIAIVVLSIAVATVVMVLANGLSASVRPDMLHTSTALAEQEMERVTGMRFSQVVSQSATNYSGNFSAYSYQITVTPVPISLANDPGMAQYKQVQVTIRHPLGGNISITGIVVNNA